MNQKRVMLEKYTCMSTRVGILEMNVIKLLRGVIANFPLLPILAAFRLYVPDYGRGLRYVSAMTKLEMLRLT